jgi:hypothetical protein
MPAKTSAHPVIMTQRGQLERLREGLQLPGLAEALEVYDRIAQRREGEEPSDRASTGRHGGWGAPAGRSQAPPKPV